MSDRTSDLRRRKIALYWGQIGPESAPAAPEGRIDDLAYLHALADVAARAPSATALEIGARRRLTDLGLLGRLIASAPNLSDTLAIWQEHANMAGELAVMRSEIIGHGDGALWRLEFTPALFLSPQLAQFILEELTATFFSLTKDATGVDFSPFVTELPFPANDRIDYARYFPGPVHFQRRHARITGPANFLNLPQRAGDPETFGLLLAHVAKAGDYSGTMTTRQRLYEYFLSSPKRAPRLEDAAAMMGMSTRTLDRRLSREGTSFSRLLAQFRHAWTCDLLRSAHVSIAQVADLLGYHNENSFRRAFQHWSGAPVGAWRRNQRRQT